MSCTLPALSERGPHAGIFFCGWQNLIETSDCSLWFILQWEGHPLCGELLAAGWQSVSPGASPGALTPNHSAHNPEIMGNWHSMYISAQSSYCGVWWARSCDLCCKVPSSQYVSLPVCQAVWLADQPNLLSGGTTFHQNVNYCSSPLSGNDSVCLFVGPPAVST